MYYFTFVNVKFSYTCGRICYLLPYWFFISFFSLIGIENKLMNLIIIIITINIIIIIIIIKILVTIIIEIINQ